MKTETAKHTPEPWDIIYDNDTGPDDDYYVEWFQVGPARVEVQRGNREKAESNARRVQACVNACKGIADPSVVPELLEACEAVMHAVRMRFNANEILHADSPIRQSIEAAIRKATTQPD